MITLEQAKQLRHGKIIHQNDGVNADGTCIRWRVSGAVKTWVRNSKRIRVPLKHGMYDFGYLFQDVDQVDKTTPRGNLGVFHLSCDCKRGSK